MNVAEFLKLIGFSAEALADFLRAIAIKVPELATTVEEWIAKLNEPLTAENLAAVLAVLPTELLAILRGQLEPRQHPSDGA